MFFEMLNPVQARLVIGPSIRGWFYYPVARESAVDVPIGKVVGALYHNERRDTPAIGTDTLDYGNPFAIARLDLLSFAVTVGARNDYSRRDLAHYKAGLVEVIDILVLDAVLSLNIL